MLCTERWRLMSHSWCSHHRPSPSVLTTVQIWLFWVTPNSACLLWYNWCLIRTLGKRKRWGIKGKFSETKAQLQLHYQLFRTKNIYLQHCNCNLFFRNHLYILPNISPNTPRFGGNSMYCNSCMDYVREEVARVDDGHINYRDWTQV